MTPPDNARRVQHIAPPEPDPAPLPVVGVVALGVGIFAAALIGAVACWGWS